MKRWQWLTLAALYIVGCGLGAGLTLKEVFATQGTLQFICAVFLSLFIWGIWLGVRVVRTRGIVGRGDVAFWALQIPQLESPFLTFSFYVSLAFSLGTSAQQAYITPAAGSAWTFWLNQPHSSLVLGINLFALAISILLYSVRRKQRARDTSVPLSGGGQTEAGDIDSGTTEVPSV